MKTAEERFYNYATERFRTEIDANYVLCLNLKEFKQALAEHGREIIELIDKMIEESKKRRMAITDNARDLSQTDTIDYCCEFGYKTALIELKEAIEGISK